MNMIFLKRKPASFFEKKAGKGFRNYTISCFKD